MRNLTILLLVLTVTPLMAVMYFIFALDDWLGILAYKVRYLGFCLYASVFDWSLLGCEVPKIQRCSRTCRIGSSPVATIRGRAFFTNSQGCVA